MSDKSEIDPLVAHTLMNPSSITWVWFTAYIMRVSSCRLQGTYADEGLRFKMIGEAGRFDELAGLFGVLEFIY